MDGMDAPQWSSITEPDAWHAFERLIADEVAARGWTVDLAEGWAYDGDVQFGLFNVAGKCWQVERALWPEVVGEHFALIAATAARSVPGFADADEARATMKARLLTDAYKQETGADLLELRVAEDLIAVVAYDLPENVMLPERADVLQYGDERELLALALRHAREEEASRSSATSCTARRSTCSRASRSSPPRTRCGWTAFPSSRPSSARWSASRRGTSSSRTPSATAAR